MTSTFSHTRPEVQHGPDHVTRIRSVDGAVTSTVRIDDRARTCRIDFTVAHGRRTRTASEDVLAAIFDLPELATCHELHAALPLGASDLVAGLTNRLAMAHTRAAGVTCLLDATITNGEERT